MKKVDLLLLKQRIYGNNIFRNSPRRYSLLEKKSGNKGIQKKIQSLLEDIKKRPFEGIGKPHALKHNLSGSWVRRINDQHRLVYQIEDDLLIMNYELLSKSQSVKGLVFFGKETDFFCKK